MNKSKKNLYVKNYTRMQGEDHTLEMNIFRQTRAHKTKKIKLHLNK